MLGILMLDTAFPRIRGDVGAVDTFDFPVIHERISGATVEDVVHRDRPSLVPAFIAGGRRLVDAGCHGIATTCGFLVRWQRELTQALDVPVLTSALMQAALVERTLPAGQRLGVVTYSAADLTADTMMAAGLPVDTPMAGVAQDGYFARTILHGAASLDVDRMRTETIDAARRLVDTHPDVGAIVLECANMPPYREAVGAATGRPVFDAALLFAWFHAGLAGRARAPESS